jgi:hypothetical protein
MTFDSRVHWVDLSGVSDPTQRALEIVAHKGQAAQKLGRPPTHVLAEKSLRLDIETLYEYGLRVKRLGWHQRHKVRLTAELSDPEPGYGQGAPARVSAQAQLM